VPFLMDDQTSTFEKIFGRFFNLKLLGGK